MNKPGLLIAALLLLSPFSSSRANEESEAVCDGIFHWVDVPGNVNVDGSMTGFEYLCQTGSADGPLLIYLGGGGVCWSGDTCDCQPNALGECTGPNSVIVYGFANRSTSDDGLRWAQ